MKIVLFRLVAFFLFPVTAISRAQPANDCRMAETATHFVLTNAKIQIRLDRRSGVITGLLNKTTGTEYLGNGKPDNFRLEYSTFESHGASPKDIWSAGYRSVIPGSKQQVSSHRFEQTPTGAKFTLTYDSTAPTRRRGPVGFGPKRTG